MVTQPMAPSAYASQPGTASSYASQPSAPAPPSSPSPMPGVPTVVRAPTPARGAAALRATPARGLPIAPGRAAVFRPDRDVAEPDEPTRRWDSGAVLIHTRVRPTASPWQRHRRPLVLAGASLWMALLVAILWWKDARDAANVPAIRPTAVSAPIVAAPPEPATAENIVEPSVDRVADLEAAIAAYDNGRPTEALRYFRRLAADPHDETARFMVRLIESRAAQP
jgi:hypothetical protein